MTASHLSANIAIQNERHPKPILHCPRNVNNWRGVKRNFLSAFSQDDPYKIQNVEQTLIIMKNRIVWTLVMALAATSILAADEPSFNGSWKLNISKSQVKGQTVTFEKTASGLIHFDTEGFGYDFDLKGNPYPTPDGGTMEWVEITPTNWQGTNFMGGKVIGIYTLSISEDSLTFSMKLKKPDGNTMEQSTVSTRVSGGPGFFGKWKSSEVKGAPTTVEIATKGQNGITITYPEFQQACKAKFDGKEYPLKEAGKVSKFTLAFERTGPTTFKMTTNLDGKPFYVDTLTLSPDGNTLTDDGNAVSVDEPVKFVYDRQ